MKKTTSKLLSLFLAVIFIITSCFGPALSAFATEINTTKIITGLKVIGEDLNNTLDDGTKVYEKYTGASINMYANFEVSGTDVDIANATVKIWLPKDGQNYIKSVKFSGSYNASSVVFSGDNDPNEFSVSYNFKRLRGGMVGGYPFSFKFENIITPPNVEQPVYFSIYDENGNLVYNKEEKVIIRSMASTNYKAAKYVGSTNYKEYSYRLYPDYLSTEPPTQTPSELTKTKVTFLNRFIPIGNGTGTDQGEYRASKVKVVDYLPEGAVFLEDDPTNIKYGWKKKDDNTYEAVLEKGTSNYKELFETGNLIVPIVLSFPNAPLMDIPSNNPLGIGKTTKTFTNTSDFYFYTLDNGVEKEKKVESTEADRSAKAAFFYKPTVAGSGTSYTYDREIVNGGTNYVNVSDNPNDISVINGYDTGVVAKFVPKMDFINVYPKTNPDRLVWKSKTDINQFTIAGHIVNGEPYQGNSLKRLFDRLGVNSNYSAGFADDGTWYSHTMTDKNNKPMGHINDARFYFKEMIFKAEVNESLKSDGSNSLEDLKKAKFWVFKTFSNGISSYYAKDSTGLPEVRNENKPFVLVPVADHPFSLDETIKINDEAGYYTGLTTIATDDLNTEEVRAIQSQTVIPWQKVIEEYDDGGVTKWRLKGLEDNTGEEHSLRLKNVHLHQIVTYRPVKEGGKSITEKNQVFVAPHSYDFFSRFSEDVLKAKNDNDPRTAPGDVFYSFITGVGIPPAEQGFDQVQPRRYIGEPDTNTDAYYDAAYEFRPNNAKINLTVSGDKSYMYTNKDPEHVGSFIPMIFDAIKDLTAKNVKGVVLLPPGVEYVSTETFGQAIGEPEIVENFKNTGRQAIVYYFGDVAVKAKEDKSLGKVSYKVRITKKAKDSASTQKGNTVETWMSWDNPALIWASTEDKNGYADGTANGVGVTDTWDLNQNDDTKDELLKSKYDLYYYAPSEVIISQYVSDASSVNIDNGDTADDWASWTQDSRFVDIGSDVYFRMFLVNQYIKTIDKLTIVERMPALDDHKMVANEAGVYPLRGPLDSQTGSFFPVHLTKKLGELKPNIDVGLFDFEYTLSPILSDAENPDPYAEKDIVKEEDWIKESDLDAKLAELGKTMADITGFRAILKEGKKIPGIVEENRAPEGENPIEWYKSHPQLGNTASIYIPAKLPYDTSLDRNLPAYMSSAYKLANPGSDEYSSFSLNEANEARVNNMYYTIGGTVFRDYKHTGDLTSDRFANIKATLEFAEETTIGGVTYAAGDKVPSKLVKVGRLDQEHHRVVPVLETSPAALINMPSTLMTPMGVDGDSVGSNPTSTYTDENGNYYFVVYKRGKYQVRFETNPADKLQTFVQYGSPVGKLRANTAAPAPAASDFPLAEPTTTTITAVEAAIDASPTIVNYNNDGSIDYLGGTLHNVANAAIDDQKRDLVVFKYGIDEKAKADALRVALSATFKLTGVTNPDFVKTITTDAKTGEFRVEDLPYGDYILEETDAPKGIVKLNNPIRITVNNEGVTFDQANPEASSYEFVNERIEVKNIVPKGNIIIHKNSSVAPNKPLENVVFGIYQNGKPVLDETDQPLKATTDGNGKAVFTNLPAGTTYTIKEEKSIEGYTTKWQKSAEEVVDLSQGVNVELPLAKDDNEVTSENANEVTNEGASEVTSEVTSEGASVELALNNIPNKATIKVKKADEKGNPIEGTTFGLYDNANPPVKLKEATTNAAGVATFEDVAYGEYTVKETKAAEGYQSVDTTYTVKVLVDKATYWVPGLGAAVVNQKIKGNIEFTKVDENGNALEGAVFDLYKGTSATGDIIKTVTTGDTGKVEFKDLEYGDYTIKESTAPDGYLATDDLTAKIENDDETILLGTEGKVVNKTIKGSIKFTKVDADGYGKSPKVIKPIEGVVFKLYKAKKQETIDGTSPENAEGSPTETTTGTNEDAPAADSAATTMEATAASTEVSVAETPSETADEGTSTETPSETAGETDVTPSVYVKDGDAIATVTTGEDGVVEFADLPYGHYVIEEETPATGYNGSTKLLHVQITENGKTISPTEDGYFTNKVIQGSVTLTKTDGAGDALQGAKFKLSNDHISYEATSGEDGKVEFADVVYGTYTLTEVSAPTKYDPWTGSKEVKVEKDGIEVKAGTIKNTLIRGDIAVQKTSSPDKTPLENASFKLYQKLDENNNPTDPVMKDDEEYTVTTDKEGKAVFEDLPYGTYYVQESKAPKGYRLNAAVEKIEILQSKTYTASFTNEKIRGSVEITKQDAQSKALLPGATFKLYEIAEENGKKVLGDVFKEGGAEFVTVTGDNGIGTIEGVPYGSYFVKEVGAPNGYVLSGEPMKITITEQDAVEKVTVLNDKKTGSSFTYTGSNETQTGSLKIIKTSSDGKVSGFTFRIEDKNHNIIEKSTDASGIILLENLAVGSYRVSEVADKVSEGYDRPASVQVEISNKKVTEINMHNVKKPEVPAINQGTKEPEQKPEDAGITQGTEEGGKKPSITSSVPSAVKNNPIVKKIVGTADSAGIAWPLVALSASAAILGTMLWRKKRKNKNCIK